ncbi:tyrosine-type recombinase/integrase, partial [Mesorhizobium sp. M7A.F.Ca.MR.362.00.0.0]
VDDFLNFVEHHYIQTIQESHEKEPVKKRLIHYYNLNKERDLAFLSLILGSGLRVNETIMLNLGDIDWIERGARVERKGKEGKTLVHFSNRAKEKLQDYVKMREDRYRVGSKEKSVFLSLP